MIQKRNSYKRLKSYTCSVPFRNFVNCDNTLIPNRIIMGWMEQSNSRSTVNLKSCLLDVEDCVWKVYLLTFIEAHRDLFQKWMEISNVLAFGIIFIPLLSIRVVLTSSKTRKVLVIRDTKGVCSSQNIVKFRPSLYISPGSFL